jgi:hypothetical protein
MDAGELDRNFSQEIAKLSTEQLEELCRLLTERTKTQDRR